MHGTIRMSRIAHKVMRANGSGAVISVSSGSGNHPTPQLAVYSATKAAITQFSRSMHVECWGTGVDWLVVTPYYIVSNLFKRKSGTLIAPMASALVSGTFCQLGKQYIWQGHGYWFHGLLAGVAAYWWGTLARWNKIMKDNRARYDARQAKDAKAAGKKD
jgi:NAD(P)-dependent dehydrogenase (short-subunit alcohol dehydrogenase family)